MHTFKNLVLLFISVWYLYYYAHVEVRGKHVKVRSFLPPCGFQGSNSTIQAWGKAPLLAELPC